jgi:hypothetical protein
MTKGFLYCLSFLALLCWLSAVTLALNSTSKPTEPEEDHSYTEELLEHFFEDYGDGDGNIIASQLCNFTQKLSGCKAAASGGDGHDHGGEKTVEKLVEGTEEHGEEHEEEHGEEHEEEHGEEHEEEGPVRVMQCFH